MFKRRIKSVVLIQTYTMSELEDMINLRIKTRNNMGQKCKGVHTYVEVYQHSGLVHEIWCAQLTF